METLGFANPLHAKGHGDFAAGTAADQEDQHQDDFDHDPPAGRSWCSVWSVRRARPLNKSLPRQSNASVHGFVQNHHRQHRLHRVAKRARGHDVAIVRPADRHHVAER